MIYTIFYTIFFDFFEKMPKKTVILEKKLKKPATLITKWMQANCCGAEGGTRTPMRLPSADFESAPSTIPALRLIQVLSLTNEFRIA